MATRTARPRLPGVFFPAQSTALRLDLPPLDVAAFAGFAERGPLDLPVALEDMAAFDAIFGGELALARTPDGSAAVAQLRGAVTNFFRNGGRRCYAVRVAARPPSAVAAVAAQFVVPGLVGLDQELRVRPAMLSAANPGKWAQRMALAARLEVTALPRARFGASGPRRLRWNPTSAPTALWPGDVLRLSYADGQRFLAPVTAMTRLGDPSGDATLELAGLWPLFGPANTPTGAPSTVRLLNGAGSEPALEAELLASQQGQIRLTVAVTDPELRFQPRDLVVVILAGRQYLFGIESVQHLGAADSPPAARIELRGRELLGLWPEDVPVESPPSALRAVERLRLSIQIRFEATLRPIIDGMGFGAGHPHFWGDEVFLRSSLLATPAASTLQWLANDPATDETHAMPYRSAETAAQTAARQFRELAAGRRPTGELARASLAALAAPLAAPEREQIFLPVGMPEVLDNTSLRGPLIPGNDGLTILDASVFLDPDLAQLRVPATLERVARERYDGQERRLFGMHSLLVIDEVAMIGVPDAAQRPWLTAEPAPLPVLPVAPPPPTPPPCAELDSSFIACTRVPVINTISPSHGPLEGAIIVAIIGAGFAQPGTVTVRFGAHLATEVIVVDDSLLRCRVPHGAAPVTVEVTVSIGDRSAVHNDAFTYQAAATIPELPPQAASGSYDLATAPLLTVQRALLTLCQARGDALALLSLPDHFRRRDCIAWLQRLRSELGLPIRRLAGAAGEGLADLSYAAVFHPWLLQADASAPGGMRAVNPEGAVAGQIALRERERGVWIAPANQPLQGTLGLAPDLSDDDHAELFALQFNLIRAEARDFRVSSAHTLSDEHALLQISVRRLLMLLRKAVAVWGMDLVFLNNHEQFREGARTLLSRMLLDLYERGAFAGSTPEQSYHVETGPAANSPQSIEQGRFVAEIRIAPSQPAEFISVTLVNAQGRLEVAEGRR